MCFVIVNNGLLFQIKDENSWLTKYWNDRFTQFKRKWIGLIEMDLETNMKYYERQILI